LLLLLFCLGPTAYR